MTSVPAPPRSKEKRHGLRRPIAAISTVLVTGSIRSSLPRRVAGFWPLLSGSPPPPPSPVPAHKRSSRHWSCPPLWLLRGWAIVTSCRPLVGSATFGEPSDRRYSQISTLPLGRDVK